MEESGIFLVPGDAEMGQHIIYINKPGPQEIFVHKKEKEVKHYGFKYTHKKSCVIYSSQKALYTGDEKNPSISVVGDIVKKRANWL